MKPVNVVLIHAQLGLLQLSLLVSAPRLMTIFGCFGENGVTGSAVADGPPVARVAPVTATLFGVEVTDRYRWMEAEGPEWRDYVQAEGADAARTLARIPGRDALAAAIDRIAVNGG